VSAPASPAPLHFHRIMAALIFVEVLSSLEHVMVVTALPAVVRDFGDLTTAGWLMTAFLRSQAASAAVGGRLGDMFGRRRVLMVVVAAAAVGSMISALAEAPGLIILGRAVQGLSGAILPLCYGITRQVAPPGRSAFWIGVLTGAYTLSSIIGYVLGGYLADIGEWRWMFYLTTGYAVAALIPLALAVPALTPARVSRRFDWIGAVIFAPAVAAILFALTASRGVGWLTWGTGGVAIAGVAALLLWFVHEWRCDSPLIDVRLLRQRPIWLGNVCGGLMSLGLMQLPVVTLLLLQQPRLAGVGLAVSGTMAGLLKLPSNVAAAVGAPLSGWIAGRSGARWATLAGALCGAAAWIWLYFFHDTVAQVVVGTIAGGFGSAMLMASIPNLVLEGAPLERSSEVTGLSAVVRTLCAAVGAQVIAVMLASSVVVEPETQARFPSGQAYEIVFLAVAGTSILIAALCIVVQIATVAGGAKVAARTARAS
jgi:MFS family permease